MFFPQKLFFGNILAEKKKQFSKSIVNKTLAVHRDIFRQKICLERASNPDLCLSVGRTIVGKLNEPLDQPSVLPPKKVSHYSYLVSVLERKDGDLADFSSTFYYFPPRVEILGWKWYFW